MTAAEATVEVFWTAYQALPIKERMKLLKKIVKSDEAYEDMIDIAAIRERKGGPSISWEEYQAQHKSRSKK